MLYSGKSLVHGLHQHVNICLLGPVEASPAILDILDPLWVHFYHRKYIMYHLIYHKLLLSAYHWLFKGHILTTFQFTLTTLCIQSCADVCHKLLWCLIMYWSIWNMCKYLVPMCYYFQLGYMYIWQTSIIVIICTKSSHYPF